MNLGDYLTISIECDFCGEVKDAIMGVSTYQAAKDFADDGWILKDGSVVCPDCIDDDDDQ